MKKQLTIPDCDACKVRARTVFKDLSGAEFEHLHLEKSCNFYKKGQVIYFEGNHPSGLFCIHDGKVKIFKIGQEGKEQIIRFAKAGDVLGYRGLISGETYSASAETLDDSRICFIPKDVIFDLFKKNGNFSLNIIKLLSQDLEDIEQRMVNLAQKPVRERLAEALIILKETYGMDKNDENCINVTLTREDLANIVGTATETVIRLLSDFKKEKIIASKGKKIQILDIKKLIKVSNLAE